MTIQTSLSIHELYNIKKSKDKKQLLCFEHILEICFKKIKRIAELGGLNIYFAIPHMLIGYPLYDFEKCSEYVIKILKKKGFLVRRMSVPYNDTVYISWDIKDINPSKCIKAY